MRSAVEHNPLDDDDEDDFGTFSKPATQKQKFLRLVTPITRARQSKNLNLDAYVIPTQFHDKPDHFRTGSPYQQLVENPETVHKLHEQDEQGSRVKIGKLSSPKVICHITNWSFYRKGEGKFVPENLDSKLCTHIIYSFATLDPEALELREFDPWGDIENQLYARTVNLDQNVPVLLGMGGWTDSSGDKYSRLVSDPRRRSNFVQRAVSFLRQYGFSGAHIDWNYPSCPQSDCRGGPARDRDDFTKFIQVRTKQTLSIQLK